MKGAASSSAKAGLMNCAPVRFAFAACPPRLTKSRGSGLMPPGRRARTPPPARRLYRILMPITVISSWIASPKLSAFSIIIRILSSIFASLVRATTSSSLISQELLLGLLVVQLHEAVRIEDELVTPGKRVTRRGIAGIRVGPSIFDLPSSVDRSFLPARMSTGAQCPAFIYTSSRVALS